MVCEKCRLKQALIISFIVKSYALHYIFVLFLMIILRKRSLDNYFLITKIVVWLILNVSYYNSSYDKHIAEGVMVTEKMNINTQQTSYFLLLFIYLFKSFF